MAAAPPKRTATRTAARSTGRRGGHPGRTPGSRAVRPDAISLILQDHRAVEELFRRYEATTGRARKARGDLVARITRELSVHAAMEELVFYPLVRNLPELDPSILEGLEEHHLVKLTLAELEGMDSREERFHPKVTVLIEHVRHHAKEEEKVILPQVRRRLDREILVELGAAMAEARELAPSRPHPGAPDTPPANLAASMASAPLDIVRDAGDSAVEAAGRAVRTAIDRVLARS